MGEAMAVTQQQVGSAGQGRQRAQRRGDFAKRQQPRHVGEPGRPPRQRRLDELQIPTAQYGDRGPGDAGAVLESDIDAGHQDERAQTVPRLGLTGQALLQSARLA